jgi:hypothetical protein
MCIGNNHSTIMAWRKRAESARTYRIWSRIVRRMVVVLYPEKAVNWASFMTHARPERKFAASLADQSGFEPKGCCLIIATFGASDTCWREGSQVVGGDVISARARGLAAAC